MHYEIATEDIFVPHNKSVHYGVGRDTATVVLFE